LIKETWQAKNKTDKKITMQVLKPVQA